MVLKKPGSFFCRKDPHPFSFEMLRLLWSVVSKLVRILDFGLAQINERIGSEGKVK
jgi:hypothetical protein